jgi:hypothetical protein
MIVFELLCHSGSHRFEGWFGSSDDFAHQQERGLVACPQCGSASVIKAPMAPAVPRKGNQQAASAPSPTPGAETRHPVMNGPPIPPQVAQALQKIAAMQAEAIKQSEWVGNRFAEESRAIHYGEREDKPIHGKASAKEAQELLDEGIAVAPLLIPIAPPDEVN